MARRKLTIGDFQRRFEIDDDTNKLFYDGKPLATEVGLKKPEFVLACGVFVVTVMSCIASWISACNRPPQPNATPASSPPSVTVSPTITVAPLPLAKAESKSATPKPPSKKPSPPKQPCNCDQSKATPQPAH